MKGNNLLGEVILAGPSPASVRQNRWVHTLAAKLSKQSLVLSLTGFGRGAVDLAEKMAVATFTIEDPEPVAGGDSRTNDGPSRRVCCGRHLRRMI